jgi:hypothetical protein
VSRVRVGVALGPGREHVRELRIAAAAADRPPRVERAGREHDVAGVACARTDPAEHGERALSRAIALRFRERIVALVEHEDVVERAIERAVRGDRAIRAVEPLRDVGVEPAAGRGRDRRRARHFDGGGRLVVPRPGERGRRDEHGENEDAFHREPHGAPQPARQT